MKHQVTDDHGDDRTNQGGGLVRTQHLDSPTTNRRAPLMLLGAALAVPAALFLLPSLLSVVAETSIALPLRLLNAVVFTVPAALMVYAGVRVMHKAAGKAPTVVIGPVTAAGRWAAWLGPAALGFLIYTTAYVAVSRPQVERFFDAPWAALPLVAAWLCGIAAFLAGTFAMALRGERSMLVLAAAAFGFVVAAFGAGEVLFPHG